MAQNPNTSRASRHPLREEERLAPVLELFERKRARIELETRLALRRAVLAIVTAALVGLALWLSLR
jgi:hypothetical protein